MKKRLLVSLLFLLAILASSTAVFANIDGTPTPTPAPCVEPNVCTPQAKKPIVHKPVPKPRPAPVQRTYAAPAPASDTYVSSKSTSSVTITGANEAELADLRRRISDLENKPEVDRHPEDHDLLLTLKGQLAGMNSRLGAVEDRVNDHETRLGSLEGQCRVIAAQDQKGKWRLVDSCTHTQIKTGGGCGTGCKTAIGVTAGVAITALFLPRLKKPPVVTTLPVVTSLGLR